MKTSCESGIQKQCCHCEKCEQIRKEENEKNDKLTYDAYKLWYFIFAFMGLIAIWVFGPENINHMLFPR